MSENISSKRTKACFFDRDGVANVEIDYLHEADKTVLEDGFAEAVKLAHANGFLAILITNQAGVARGLFPEDDVHKVYARLQELLAEYGEKLDAMYYCPHYPDGVCNCRKPAPGMILKAAEEWNIDLSKSLMIGDRITDAQCGSNAGCGACYLVRTGYGVTTLEKYPASGFPVADNSCEALKDFLQKQEHRDMNDGDLSWGERLWRPIRNFFLPRLNRWFFLRLAITVVVAVLVFKFLLVPCVISGASMEPTVHSSGFTFCWRGSYWFKTPQRGDVVIIKYDNNIYFLKRIVGMPGEFVEFRDGKLFINGESVQEDYVAYPSNWNMEPVKVNENEYFVVGDNRSMPIAQHQKGAVRAQRILGQMAF